MANLGQEIKFVATLSNGKELPGSGIIVKVSKREPTSYWVRLTSLLTAVDLNGIFCNFLVYESEIK